MKLSMYAHPTISNFLCKPHANKTIFQSINAVSNNSILD